MDNSECQKISLQWNSFPANFLNTVELLWAEESFCDVTLYCNGQEFKCHKVVLSACSTTFRTLLKNSTCQHPIIIMQEMNLCDLEAILQFIYKGQVEIEQSQLTSLLKAAGSLQIRGLASIANQEIDSIVNKSQESSGEPPSKKTRRTVVGRGATSTNTVDPTSKRKPPSNKTTIENDAQEVNTQDCLPDSPNIPVKQEPLSDEEVCNVGIYLEEPEKELIMSAQNNQNEDDGDNPVDPLRDHAPSPQSELAENAPQAFTCKNSNYPPYPCPFCVRAYSSWGFRRRHVKAMHTSSSQLPCKWCGTVLSSRQVWERHVISKHSLSKPEAEQGLKVLDEAHTVLHGVDTVFVGVKDGHPPQQSDQSR